MSPYFIKGDSLVPYLQRKGGGKWGKFIRSIFKQKTLSKLDRVFKKKGDDILSHKNAVPSAQAGLTSLFEMGRGEPRRNNHLKRL